MTHQIVPGSIEADGNMVTAGVHTGENEWTIENLRYVRGDITKAQPGDTVVGFLGRIYDQSEGCAVRGDFKMIEGAE